VGGGGRSGQGTAVTLAMCHILGLSEPRCKRWCSVPMQANSLAECSKKVLVVSLPA